MNPWSDYIHDADFKLGDVNANSDLPHCDVFRCVFSALSEARGLNPLYGGVFYWKPRNGGMGSCPNTHCDLYERQ